MSRRSSSELQLSSWNSKPQGFFPPRGPTTMAAAPNSVGAPSASESNSTVEPLSPTKAKDDFTVTAPTFPEGGLQAWATVAGAFLIQFCGFGYTTSFGVYEDFYKREYLTQSSPSAIAWIGSINAFLVPSGGLIAGRLYDRGYFYHLIIAGSLLLSFSLFMLSLCQPQQLYQIFLAQGLGAGLGAGATYVPSVAIVSHYFKKRRALAMTIVAAGSSLGAVVHPLMLNNTLRSHLGFGNAVRASAGLVSGLLLIACFLMRPRLPPPAANPPLWKSLKRFSRDGVYILATLGMTTFTVGFYFPLFYLQLDAITHGVNQTLAFYSLVILNTSSFVGRVTPGFFAQRVGVINIIIAATGCGAVLLFCMIALKSVASVIVIGIIFGYCAGAFVTLMAPLIAVLTEDIGELGLRMGVTFGVVSIAGLVGPPLNGALLTGHYVWWRPALFSGLMALIGFFLFVATAVVSQRRAATSRQATSVAAGEVVGEKPPAAVGAANRATSNLEVVPADDTVET
ncbi:MFS general substrate transporter [Mycena pura]|uniref:MFS general substrate transporter n=1 Tax=Mycena pura TaxID=153505 RepID=A0AAD6YUJ9_9AGAR|nr:MFS general substrate transporter [Mycena pura]